MKKSLLIIMSVAILGGLGLYINKGSGSKVVMADSTSNTAGVNPIITSPTNTAANTAPSTTPSTSSSSSGTGASTPSPVATPTPTPAASGFKDGTYSGSTANTLYGNVQVAAVISGGKITDIQFLQMPNDQQNSRAVTAMAEPQLKSEALKAQNAHISNVSGATQSTAGYKQSLQAALDKAAA